MGCIVLTRLEPAKLCFRWRSSGIAFRTGPCHGLCIFLFLAGPWFCCAFHLPCLSLIWPSIRFQLFVCNHIGGTCSLGCGVLSPCVGIGWVGWQRSPCNLWQTPGWFMLIAEEKGEKRAFICKPFKIKERERAFICKPFKIKERKGACICKPLKIQLTWFLACVVFLHLSASDEVALALAIFITRIKVSAVCVCTCQQWY